MPPPMRETMMKACGFGVEGMRLDTGTPTRRASSAITVVVAVVVTWASFQGVG
jgi:hypothetical protein